MTTWGDLRGIIGAKVNDPNLSTLNETAMANANDALRLIASIHTGLASVSDIVGDGEASEFPVPDGCIEPAHDGIIGIIDTYENVWLRFIRLIPGEEIEDGYYLVGDSTIVFNPAPVDGRTYRIYYEAYYSEITDDDSVISAPTWAIEAIKLYTAGRTLEDIASQMALLGQFRTRVDSGNPEDQPILRLSERYIRQFWDLLDQHKRGRSDR